MKSDFAENTMNENFGLNKNNFGDVCRICMLIQSEMKPIKDVDIINTLKACTSVKIELVNNLPDKICSNCIDKTQEVCNFIKLCEDTEQELLEILNRQETPSEIDDFDNKDDIIDSIDDFKLDKDPELSKVSTRKAQINWVMTLGSDQCDTSAKFCKICNKTLVNISSLARHMETHNENRKYTVICEVCKKVFYEKGNYLRHLLRHKREAIHKCDHCSKTFYELSILCSHLQKAHNIEPIPCQQCDKKFVLKSQLETHIKKHNNNFDHICSQCGKGYFLLRRLEEHLLTHEKTYLCPICHKVYKNHSSLNKHNIRYHKSPHERQVCQVCGKTVLHMKAHMLIHNGARLFDCHDCKKSFIHRSDLVAHCKRKHCKEPQVLPYLCNICGKRKLSNTALEQHIIHAHTTEKTQKCTLCPKVFKTDNALKSHVRYSHKDVRNYKCDICEKGFYTNAILRNHMRTHTGERPFVCHICSRGFGKNSTLKTHMKIHGTADFAPL